MVQLDPVKVKRQRKLALTWGITFLALFPLLSIPGFIMRLSQGELIKLLLANFYAFMTLHGLGMMGLLFSMAFAAIWYLISTRFATLNIRVGYFVFFATLTGMAGLATGTLIGKFGPGPYLLYSLSFKDPTWVSWSIEVSVISIIVLCIGWLTGIIHLLFSLLKKYRGFINLLGWQYLRKKNDEKEELPPVALITTISLIAGIIGLLAGTILMAMYLFQSFESVLGFDPLFLKNLALFFINTLVNITLYLSVGCVYALLPEFTGRAWKTNKSLVYAWNVTLFLTFFIYLYHLYIYFTQPLQAQYAERMVSYLSTVPAIAITISGMSIQLYHSEIKWSIVPLMFLSGTAGIAIGAFSDLAVFSVAVDKVFHHTLWVPAQVHTYALTGITLFIIGFLFYLFAPKSNPGRDRIAKAGLWIFITGSFGFLLMLYLGGLDSIPASYARYTGVGMGIKSMHTKAVFFSQASVAFIIISLAGLFILYFSLLRPASGSPDVKSACSRKKHESIE